VIYGVVGLKTHAKIALVVREEEEGLRRYCHIGTGNYNPVTARTYEDLGLLTAEPSVCRDVAELFGRLTSGSGSRRYERLLVAPEALSRAYFEEGGGRRVGASWMTREDREVEIEDYVRYLDLLGHRILAAVPEPPRVQVHAFSQGTATACRWISFGGFRTDRLVLWGGGVPPDLPLDRYGPTLTRNGLVIAIGNRDKYISQADVDREQARLAAAGLTPTVHRFDGGHRVDADLLRTFSEES